MNYVAEAIDANEMFSGIAPSQTKADVLKPPYDEGQSSGIDVGDVLAQAARAALAEAAQEVRARALRTLVADLPQSLVEDLMGALTAEIARRATEPASSLGVKALRMVAPSALVSGQTLPEVLTRDVLLPANLQVLDPRAHADVIEGDVAEDAPPAYRAFKDLAEWLEARDDEVAEAVGIGRTTPYTWKRDNREPRRGSAQRIYEFHAVLLSLLRQLGATGLRTWLFSGNPSRRDLLLRGDLEATERAVHEVLFRAHDSGVDLAWSPEPENQTEANRAPRASTPRRSRRKVNRVRRQ